jgi:hypothetical protein
MSRADDSKLTSRTRIMVTTLLPRFRIGKK